MTDNIFRKARLLAAKKIRRFSDGTMAAYALGMSPNSLYRIERGEIPATPDDVSNMLKIYKSMLLVNEYCAKCPVMVEKRKLENKMESNDSRSEGENINE